MRDEAGLRVDRTLYDKVWASHIVKTYEDGSALLYIDRHIVQEVSSPQAFAGLSARGREVRCPPLPYCRRGSCSAHPPGETGRRGTGWRNARSPGLEMNTQRYGIRYLPVRDRRHGIVHVIGPELGFTLPGTTLVCGDSHTCTHGAFGAIAFGIGSSECECVLATQTLRQP